MAHDYSIIDQINDEYESAIQSGNELRIEDLLERIDQPNRLALFEQLVRTELEYRHKSNEAVGIEEYRKRFPEHTDVINSLAARFGDQETVITEGVPGLGRSSWEGASEHLIGPYKLVRPLGVGGMGEVWLAEQTRPVQREVAIKLIRTNCDQKNFVARFEAERQALALMDHPNITSVYDAGETAEGMPFLVMEVVDGVPLTQYCEHNCSSIQDRLRLFASVCDAVQHAHQKGVIHRDLKPSNILVCEYGGVATAKVIDFGLAKATESGNQITDNSLVTEFGRVVGTVLYMSPEQAQPKHHGIDTRADIYSLGVVLYELLTDSTPIARSALNQQSILTVITAIKEQEAPRPSHRLAESNSLEQIARERQIDPKRLVQILKGDLDWIVTRAIEKNRDRRYQSASELAEDVRRYLNGEPVVARPPSIGYKLTTFIRKNRLLVGSAALATSLLVLGLIGTTWFALKSNLETARANGEAVRASQEASRANQEAANAKEQSQVAFDTLTGVIRDLHDEIRQVSGSADVRRRLLAISLKQIGKIAAENIDNAEFNIRQMRLLIEMGLNLQRHGVKNPEFHVQAEEYLSQARIIGEKIVASAPDNREAHSSLASAYQLLSDSFARRGDTVNAEALDDKALEIRLFVAERWPENEGMLRLALMALLQHAHDARGRGELQKSEALFLRAIAYGEKHGFPLEQVQACTGYAAFLRKTDPDEAMKWVIKASGICHELTKAEPENLGISIEYAKCLRLHSQLLAAKGNNSEAIKRGLAALDIVARLYEENESSLFVYEELLRCHLRLGKNFQTVKQRENAKTHYNAIMAMIDFSLPVTKINILAKSYLRDTTRILGELHLEEDDFEQATKFLEMHLEVCDTLRLSKPVTASQISKNLEVLPLLLKAYENLSDSENAQATEARILAAQEKLTELN